MVLFGNKKNGDYFIEMIQSLSDIKADCGHFKSDMKDVKADVKEHRNWQIKIDKQLSEAINCPRGGQIDDIQKVVNDLTTDKVQTIGKILGRKTIWVPIATVIGLGFGIAGILFKLGII